MFIPTRNEETTLNHGLLLTITLKIALKCQYPVLWQFRNGFRRLSLVAQLVKIACNAGNLGFDPWARNS